MTVFYYFVNDFLLQQIDLEEEESVMSAAAPHRGNDEDGVDLFNLATQYSSIELDAKSGDPSSTTYGGHSLFSEREYIPEAIGIETKLEQVLCAT